MRRTAAPGTSTRRWPCHSVTRRSTERRWVACRSTTPRPASQFRSTRLRRAAGSPANPAQSSSSAPVPGTWRASSSSRSASSRASWAVRARASATPGPSSVSRSGMTRSRTRTRAKAGSALCGSVHGSMPDSAQTAAVVARRSPRKGRRKHPRRGRMPAKDRSSGATRQTQEHGLGLIVQRCDPATRWPAAPTPIARAPGSARHGLLPRGRIRAVRPERERPCCRSGRARSGSRPLAPTRAPSPTATRDRPRRPRPEADDAATPPATRRPAPWSRLLPSRPRAGPRRCR